MRPITIALTLAAADDDGVAQSQTPGAAGNLTLNGVLVTAGVAILTVARPASGTPTLERQVLVTTVSNESAKTLTIYGTNGAGAVISEAMTGPNATTGTTTRYFATVTRVAVSAAFTGAVIVGTNAVGGTSTIIPDIHLTPFSIGIGCVVSGTINYTVQQTFDNVFSPDYDQGSATWINHSSLAAKTATADGNYSAPVQGIRVVQASGTGTVTSTFIQAGI